MLGLPRHFDPADDDPEEYPGYREKLGIFLTCPWCAGFWITLGWWAAWLLTPKWTIAVAVPWALSAAVGLVAKHLD